MAELLTQQVTNALDFCKFLTAILFQLSEGTSPTRSNKVNQAQEQQLQRLSNELEQVKISVLLNLKFWITSHSIV